MRPSVFKSKIESVLNKIDYLKSELESVEEELHELCNEGGFYISKPFITLRQIKKAE